MLISYAVPMSIPCGIRDHASVTVCTGSVRVVPLLESFPERLTQITRRALCRGSVLVVEDVLATGIVVRTVVVEDVLATGIVVRTVVVVRRAGRAGRAGAETERRAPERFDALPRRGSAPKPQPPSSRTTRTVESC